MLFYICIHWGPGISTSTVTGTPLCDSLSVLTVRTDSVIRTLRVRISESTDIGSADTGTPVYLVVTNRMHSGTPFFLSNGFSEHWRTNCPNRRSLFIKSLKTETASLWPAQKEPYASRHRSADSPEKETRQT